MVHAQRTQNWWCALLWIPSGLAVLGLLRARTEGTTDATVALRGPAGPYRLLVLLLFPVMVALNIGEYTASGALSWVWFFAYLLALAGLLRLAHGRTVGDKRLEKSGEPLNRTLRVSHRPVLLDRARTYRERHAQLRRLDHGQADDATVRRRELETELTRLHCWRSSRRRRDRLPHDVSVVDAVLVLGSGDTWWENGVRAARLTQPVALPLTAGLVWANQLRGEELTSTLHERLGLPDMLAQFILWQVGYAAAGMVLGALWHQLPGKRGPTRAFCVALAYALPAGLFASGNWALGEEQTGLAFAVTAMLLVLTLTGILMDLETFREEHRYWRVGSHGCTPYTRAVLLRPGRPAARAGCGHRHHLAVPRGDGRLPAGEQRCQPDAVDAGRSVRFLPQGPCRLTHRPGAPAARGPCGR